ncbi:hypothetical protein [Pontibacter sp. G13]|uniref:hypothetical protein n=1 Tax=Pontibacter sp. G13 TaxID=3074898 RepID=UPI00288A1812|nr:hypothetical protein [Pontibacter sp. G13]WNJ19289.1 hypothetical protein RJD25_02255 [Pontibacter sp. G13]
MDFSDQLQTVIDYFRLPDTFFLKSDKRCESLFSREGAPRFEMQFESFFDFSEKYPGLISPHFGGLMMLFVVSDPVWSQIDIQRKFRLETPEGGPNVIQRQLRNNDELHANWDHVMNWLERYHRWTQAHSGSQWEVVAQLAELLPQIEEQPLRDLAFTFHAELFQTTRTLEFAGPTLSEFYQSLIPALNGLSQMLPDQAAFDEFFATGGAEPIPEPELELPLPDISGAEVKLATQLKQDQQTAALGHFFEHLQAGLKIAPSRKLPQQERVGGVMDLTNRGNLDQLLISEWANDDHTLMARLVNQEALYLNRETPPSIPSTRRIMLVDGSIHLWGTPRQLALASALALWNEQEDAEIHFLHPLGNVPVHEGPVDHLKEILGQPNPNLHSGQELLAFMMDRTHQEGLEWVYLTCEATQRIPAHMAALDQIRDKIHHLIYCERDLSVKLFELKGGNPILKQTLVLSEPPESLQAPEKTPSVPPSSSKEDPFRLLVPLDTSLFAKKIAQKGSEGRLLFQKHGQIWMAQNEESGAFPIDVTCDMNCRDFAFLEATDYIRIAVRVSPRILYIIHVDKETLKGKVLRRNHLPESSFYRLEASTIGFKVGTDQESIYFDLKGELMNSKQVNLAFKPIEHPYTTARDIRKYLAAVTRKAKASHVAFQEHDGLYIDGQLLHFPKQGRMLWWRAHHHQHVKGRKHFGNFAGPKEAPFAFREATIGRYIHVKFYEAGLIEFKVDHPSVPDLQILTPLSTHTALWVGDLDPEHPGYYYGNQAYFRYDHVRKISYEDLVAKFWGPLNSLF